MSDEVELEIFLEKMGASTALPGVPISLCFCVCVCGWVCGWLVTRIFFLFSLCVCVCVCVCVSGIFLFLGLVMITIPITVFMVFNSLVRQLEFLESRFHL